MKVFEACGKVVKRHIGAFAMYFVIFIMLAVVMSSFYVEKVSTEFSEMKMNYAVIQRDGASPLFDGLTDYLRTHGTEIELEDRKDVLQDATFFMAVDCIVILPDGFHNAFFSGTPLPVQTVTTTETTKAYYVESLVDQYFNLTRIVGAAHPDWDESALAASVLTELSAGAEVEKRQFSESAPVAESYHVFSRMLCYILLVLVTLCVSNIMMVFRRPDIRMRNLCSPLKARSMNFQIMLCSGLISLAAWLLLTLFGFVLYGSDLTGTHIGIIALITLNTFVMTLVALSIASLASLFIRNPSVQNAVCNMVSLSLCFLGGVFVPLEVLSEGILTVSRFTPGYWYATALDSICGLTSFDAAALSPVWRAMLIELAFAAALFCVALVVGKAQSQSERAFSSIRTEVDA